ncbi:membrane bound O-acyl transferase family-domain-containing protein [Xylariomycetidae sp. FL2044]|nr:membrane bound O-acyl transferase family-domain-containing protein [Xylariomycetidae sp. FL2044]
MNLANFQIPRGYPITYLGLGFLTFHFALHSSKQRVRSLLLPLFILFSGLSFVDSKWFLPYDPSIATLWAQAITLNVVHVFSILIIEKWPPPARNGSSVWYAEFHATWWVWSNPRRLPRPGNEKAKKEESQGVFIALRLSKALIYSQISLRVIPAMFRETIVELLPEDVVETALLSRLSEVTAREAVVRLYVAIYWIWESLLHLEVFNALLTTLFVHSGRDEPSDWPPLFGRLSSACGLRNFWSHFWHQLATPSYTTCGRAVAQAMGLQRLGPLSSPATGVVVAFVAFLLSGMSHAAVSWKLGMNGWLDMQWFLLNFAGCFWETVVIAVVRRLAKEIGCSGGLAIIERSWLGRLIGYAWTFGFFFWSVPFWKFPGLHQVVVRQQRWSSILANMSIVRR